MGTGRHTRPAFYATIFVYDNPSQGFIPLDGIYRANHFAERAFAVMADHGEICLGVPFVDAYA
jgi:hypothetical protein